MDELDVLLSVIENPTRRRILEALVREPHYPLQLSRELGLSQQGIMKHLRMLEDLDLVLVMSVNPGFGGQTLVPSSFRKLEALKERIVRRGLPVLLEVDGGVKPDNAHRFASAGADVLVSGSGVFGAADRASAIRTLQRAAVPVDTA